MANKKAVERGEPGNRINTGITILPELHSEIARVAHAENRTISRVIEIMLDWATEQLKENDLASHQLKNISVRALRRKAGM